MPIQLTSLTIINQFLGKDCTIKYCAVCIYRRGLSQKYLFEAVEDVPLLEVSFEAVAPLEASPEEVFPLEVPPEVAPLEVPPETVPPLDTPPEVTPPLEAPPEEVLPVEDVPLLDTLLELGRI